MNFNDTALSRFMPLVKGILEGLITPLLRELRAWGTCETSNTCAEDPVVVSGRSELPSSTLSWAFTAWEALE